MAIMTRKRRRQEIAGPTPVRRSTRGSVLVEMALICIVFLTLLIGAFDVGQFMYIHQTMVERLRWAARWGVAQSNTDAQIKNLVIYGNTGGTGTAFFGLTTSMVTVTTAIPAAPEDKVTNVKIAGYPYMMITPFGAGQYSGPPITMSVPRGEFE